MSVIRPKKKLGQHFLADNNIAAKIVRAMDAGNADYVLEVGPGTGVLTLFLLEQYSDIAFFIDVDHESIQFLKEKYPSHTEKFIYDDFLSLDLTKHFPGKIAVVGNFPYNISSQIFFKLLEYRNEITEIVCMVQKEVAQRITEPPGNKTYGILSVLLQAYFDIKYLFTVNPGVFRPPPKVKSGVIRLLRNNVNQLECNEELFFKVVKTAFNQRRKVLRNSLKNILPEDMATQEKIFSHRPEQLTVQQFVEITSMLET